MMPATWTDEVVQNWVVKATQSVKNYSSATFNGTASASFSRTRGWKTTKSATLTGTAQWELKLWLAAAKASVGLTIGYSSDDNFAETETFTVSATGPVGPCTKANFVPMQFVRSTSGTKSGYDHRIVCKCSGCHNEAVNFCNKGTVTITAENTWECTLVIGAFEALTDEACASTVTPPTMPPTPPVPPTMTTP